MKKSQESLLSVFKIARSFAKNELNLPKELTVAYLDEVQNVLDHSNWQLEKVSEIADQLYLKQLEKILLERLERINKFCEEAFSADSVIDHKQKIDITLNVFTGGLLNTMLMGPKYESAKFERFLKRPAQKLQGLKDLAEYTDLGYSVPDSYEIATSPYNELNPESLYDIDEKNLFGKLPKKLQQEITRLLERFAGEKVIVRSNSVLESGEKSFSGIYDSVVVEKATQESLTQAIVQVNNSLFSARALNYRSEHDLPLDYMKPIIQSYIEGGYYGVIHTSNPNYPNDISVEFSHEPNAVADRKQGNMIIDFDKKSDDLEAVFESENIGTSDEKNLLHLRKIADIGRKLEHAFELPLELEFILDTENQVHLVQKRVLSDVEQSDIKVELPGNSKENKFLTTANIIRGRGVYKNLPVLRADSLQKRDIKANLNYSKKSVGLSRIQSPKEAFEEKSEYFEQIINFDQKYSDGYILLSDRFDDSLVHLDLLWADMESLYQGRGGISQKNIDEMTANKRVIIEYQNESRANHALTISRESGISYVGLTDEKCFSDIQTGDRMSVFFVDRQAHVYQNPTPAISFQEAFEGIRVKFRTDPVGLKIEARYHGVDKLLYNSLGNVLQKSLGGDWEFFKAETALGGDFIEKTTKKVVRVRGTRTAASFSIKFLRKNDFGWVSDDGEEKIKNLISDEEMQKFSENLRSEI